MVRVLLMVCVFAVHALAQGQGAVSSQPGPSPAQSANPSPAPPAGAKPPQAAEPVAQDAPVVTIHGVCPSGQPGGTEKPDSCAVVLTRAQFEVLVASMNVTNQSYNPPALRGFASGYATLLALAGAGEKAGVDKDPRFVELMKVARTRALAESYRRYLQEQFSNPPREEIEQYYQQNLARFEQARIERVQIPKVNPKRPQEKRPEFEKKARQLAEDLRQRAANGEDMTALQVEAYTTLGFTFQPPQTDLPVNPKPTFPPYIQKDINDLKPGQVTKVEFEPSGFNIYKLRAKTTIPLEQARPEIVREISQKKIDAALKAATENVRSDLNEQYFSPRPAGIVPPPRVPARMLPPGAVQQNRPAMPGASPSSGNPAPAAAKPEGVAAQKSASPK